MVNVPMMMEIKSPGFMEELAGYGSNLMSWKQKDACEAQKVQKNSCEMLALEDALTFLHRSHNLPPLEDIFITLQKCRKKKNAVSAMCLHVYMCNHGIEGHAVLGNYVVSLFVECGSMPHAHQAFNRLIYRNEHSWTSLMQGYTECGDLQYSLDLYKEMQEDCIHPSRFTYMALLKACGRMKCVERGEEMHAEIAKTGHQRDAVVGNTLVDMYAKCGSFTKAREVFNELPARDVVSWTALIGGYAEHGLAEEAMKCLKQMQLEGVSPDAITYFCGLKACGTMGAIGEGQIIHDEIIKKGFESEEFVGNTLVDMYAKSGSHGEAQKVFEDLPVQDVVSWNALIAGYADNGLGEEALDCFELMRAERVPPDAVTFVCSLKACGSILAGDRGRELHAETIEKGFQGDILIGNTLVDMYIKCGLLVEAQEVLNMMPVRNVVSWTALMAGFAEEGPCEEVLNCLERMQGEEVFPDAATFACTLKSCGSIQGIYKARGIHGEVCKLGFERDAFVSHALVDVYAKCGSLPEARKVFDKLSDQDVVLWNALIAGYAEQGLGEEALDCFDKMQSEGKSPNAVTFICSLKACGSMGDMDKCWALHSEVVMKGFVSDLVVGNTLVDAYAKCFSIEEAREVFDKLQVRDIVSWTAMIAGYGNCSFGEKALTCFQQMQLGGVYPDVVSWNAVILAYAEQEESKMAIELYARMHEQGLPPNSLTLASALKACGNTAALEVGKKIHAQIYGFGIEATTEVVLVTALLDMYSKCGSMDDAQQVFEAMPRRDPVTWNALITGYARQGDSEPVFHLFERMREEGRQPDEVAFLSVLHACSHAGLVEKGQEYFESMSKECGINPKMKHHSCMVDLLGRAGQLHEAMSMVETMAFQPDLVVWSSLLDGCHKQGDLELGRQAFEYAMNLDAEDAASFILMSNIFAVCDDMHSTL